MDAVALGLPGAPSHTMTDLQKGFSLIYSLMLAVTGGLGLIVAKRGTQDPTLMLAVARALAGCYLVMTVIGFTHFFIIPAALMAAVFVCFALASVRGPAA
jgi:CHASE2 domain-containing sensor protein